jgi:hypothetical protein
MRRVAVAFLTLCLCVFVADASAQVTLGAKGSLTLASLDASDAEGEDPDFKTRTVFGGGAYLQVGIGAAFALQAEALFTPRGARATETGATVALSYFDVPALLLFRIPAGDASITPVVYAGPVVSFETDCQLKDSDGESVECGSEGQFRTQSPDVSGAVGGALEVFMDRWTLQLDVRYVHGFVDINDTGGGAAGSVQNRSWSFFLGLGRVLVP